MNSCIRLVVIDDHPLLREGVVSVLCNEPDFEVAGEGCSASDALALSQQLQPDVLLLDVSIPGGGIEAARAVAKACPDVRIVMLTVAEDEDTVTTALQAGARGYILKGIGGPDLVATVRRTYRGESYISPHLAARLLAKMAPSRLMSDQDAASCVLTDCEEQILSRVVRGLGYDEIGREMELSQAEIKARMGDVLRKLGARNRAGAERALVRS